MKTYIVKYSRGGWDDYSENILFATTDKKTATKYVTKFNAILKKWKEYYSQFEDDSKGIKWIKPEFIRQHYDRWHRVMETNKCTYFEIKTR